MLLNIKPINEFILSEAVKGSYRLSRVSFWPAKTIGSTRITTSHVDVCNEAKENLPLTCNKGLECQKMENILNRTEGLL